MRSHVGVAGLVGPRLRQVGSAAVFALALIGAGLLLDFGLPGQGVGPDDEFGLLHALDLVAQAGRGLEVEVGRGRAHLLLEVGQHGFEVVADADGGLGEA